MAEKGPPASTPKPGKTKISVAKQTTTKTNIPLEPRIIIRPIDQQEGQTTLYPPNQPAYWADIPAAPYNNPPNPPPNFPNLPNPPSNPPNPPNPPSNPPNPPKPTNSPTKSTRSNESAKSSPTTAAKLVLL